MKTYELINLGSKFLKNKKILSSRIDSEIILSHVMGIPRERLLVDEKVIKVDKIKKFKSLILRRSENEPVAYITVSKLFLMQVKFYFFLSFKIALDFCIGQSVRFLGTNLI